MKLIFDVEATHLMGIAIAYAAIVIDDNKNIIDSSQMFSQEYVNDCCDFVKENIIPKIQDIPKCATNKEMRDAFWRFYLKHKDCEVWVDCGFPVETNFLISIAMDDLVDREFKMPYPLYEISVRNLDKSHNPMNDCLTSIAYL